MSTSPAITPIKLAELRRQHAQLHAAYDQLDATLATAHTDGDRVRALYHGLQALTFAKQPLHPDVANLDALLYEIEHARAAPDILAFWLTRLNTELARGRRRAATVYRFGALLEEWAPNTPTPTAESSQGEPTDETLTAPPDTFATLRATLLTPAESPQGEPAPDFSRLLDDTPPAPPAHQAALQEALERDLRKPVTPEELSPILTHLRRDPYRTPAFRAALQPYLSEPTWLKELADAVTIQLDHLDEWDWPSTGIPAAPLWTNGRWRLHLQEDMLTACFLEVAGARWQALLHWLAGDEQATAETRLQRLRELDAPEAVLVLEQRRLELIGQRQPMALRDLWAEDDTTPASTVHNSIFKTRARMLAAMRTFSANGDYDDGDDYPSSTGGVLALLHAEITLARTAFPDRPFYVLKLDLRNFYASVPHSVVLACLAHLGLGPDSLRFFERFLRVPLADPAGGAPTVVQRGLPIKGYTHSRRLSHALGELLLRHLDRYLTHAARVLVVRVVDDICVLAPTAADARHAWTAAHTFCAQAGLALNPDKCGAVALGGPLPADLPQNLPQWQLLQLHPDAEWRVAPNAFNDFCTQAHAAISAPHALLTRVARYNTHATHLANALALSVPLGTVHRTEINRALTHFHYALFGENEGIVAHLRAALATRFPAAGDRTEIPEAWCYWPLTAGGLGLTHPAVHIARYTAGLERRAQPVAPATRPADWQTKLNPWATFYKALLAPLEPREPQQTKVMETLVNDFIQRGSSITGGRQRTLGPYWRWILYTYGPQILEYFGTFRFLVAELVPLQLITHGRLGQLDPSDSEA